MAKVNYTKQKIVGVRASSAGLFVGVLWAVTGLGVALLHSMQGTVNIARETQSILTGLAFGVVAGAASIVVVPLVYFAIGWVIGFVYAWLFNVISEASGGIEVKLADADKK